jgi:AAHS family 3-hydroxyphenylpropionic acid transporter
LLPLVALALPETSAPVERTAERPGLGTLFQEGRARSTLLLWTASFFSLLVLYLLLNWLPSLVVAKGHSPSDGAAAALAFNAVGVAGALLLGFAVDRFGVRWSMLGAYALLASALAALGPVADLQLIILLSAAAGFMIMGVQYVLYALAPGFYPAGVRATAAGAAVAAGRAGSIVGPLLAGQLRAAGWSAREVLTGLPPLVIIAAAAVLILSWPGRQPSHGPAATIGARLRRDRV